MPEPKYDDKMTEGELLRALNWYHLNQNGTESNQYLQEYLRETGCSVIDISGISISYGYIARILSNGNVLPDRSGKSFQKGIDFHSKRDVVQEVPSVVKSDGVSKKKVASLDEYFLALGQIEYEIDMFQEKFQSDFSMKSWLHSTETKAKTASIYADAYQPLLNELRLALDDEYFKESYGLGKVKLRKFIKFMESIINDCIDHHDANKRVRKKKVMTPEQLVKGVKCQKTYEDFESVNPVNIIGSRSLVVFNTKTRKLSIYHADTKDGLSIKGTTLKEFDTVKSVSKTLRKPSEILKTILVRTRKGLEMLFDDVRAKPFPCNGRLNQQTVLLRVIRDGDD